MRASTSPMRIRSTRLRRTSRKRLSIKRSDRQSSRKRSSPSRRNQTSPRTRWLLRECKGMITAPTCHRDRAVGPVAVGLSSSKNLKIARSQCKTWAGPWSIHCLRMGMSYPQISAITRWTTVCLKTSWGLAWSSTINWTVLDKGSLTHCFRHTLTLLAIKLFWVIGQRRQCR